MRQNLRIVFFLILFSGHFLSAQNVEEVLRGKIFDASGHIQAAQTFYGVSGRSPSRKPFGYLLSGSLNLRLFGFLDAPFTFQYTNQGGRFTQPGFNQTAFHPKYKWVQLHLGDIAASWSPYTLNGHLFSGAGVDLTPGKWTLSACGGRFQKAVQPIGIITDADVKPVYRRMGAGLKLGYRYGADKELAATVFYAMDDTVGLAVAEWSDVVPKENLCAGITANWSGWQRFRIRTEAGISLMDEDIRNKVNPLWSETSKGVYRAFKASVDAKLFRQVFTGGYERIDPHYRTLGAYYFNNDLENVTIGSIVNMPEMKLNIQGSVGKQRDNLNGTNPGFMQRTVSQFQGQWRPFPRFNVQGGYSDFLCYSGMRSFEEYNQQTNPFRLWDTLNFRQISRNMNLGIHMIPKEDSVYSRSLNLQFTAQNTAERRNETVMHGALFLNASLVYGVQNKKSGLRFSAAVNASQTEISDKTIMNLSPVISAGAVAGKSKIAWNLTAVYTQSRSTDQWNQGTFSFRCGLNRLIHSVHRLSLNAMLLQGPVADHSRFTEYSLGMMYSMSLVKKKK